VTADAIQNWTGWDSLPVVHFLILSATIIGAALAVVTLRNLVHAALCLIILFGATAGFFLLLNAEFLAFAQVLIYMGGISILILFAIMLSRKLVGWDIVMTNRQSIPAAIVCMCLGALLLMPPPIGMIHSVDWSPEPSLSITKQMLLDNPEMAATAREYFHQDMVQWFEDQERQAAAENREPIQAVGTTNWYAPNSLALGQSLMSTYTLIFWVASFILTVAMIGSLYIARKDDGMQTDPRGEEL